MGRDISNFDLKLDMIMKQIEFLPSIWSWNEKTTARAKKNILDVFRPQKTVNWNIYTKQFWLAFLFTKMVTFLYQKKVAYWWRKKYLNKNKTLHTWKANLMQLLFSYKNRINNDIKMWINWILNVKSFQNTMKIRN